MSTHRSKTRAPLRRDALGLLLGLLAWPTWAQTTTPSRQTRTPALAQPGPYARHEAASSFAAAAAERQGLPLGWVLKQLAQARREESVRRLIMPPAAGTAKNWAAYRARFIEPRRVAAGVAFWRDNEAWLQEAQDRWGVPAEIVVGIIGVET
ncbi:MAG: lytic murein transglycosylase, partial [Burkholderiaceae bacterium]|nr:lytic murein transglycosylase [Burkholderiaceae bacterium]